MTIQYKMQVTGKLICKEMPDRANITLFDCRMIIHQPSNSMLTSKATLLITSYTILGKGDKA